MLNHFEKGCRDLELLAKEQSAKVNGLPVSNLATLAWKISQEEVKLLAKLRPSFFWGFRREAMIHPQWQDSSETDLARFVAANWWKFGHVRLYCCRWVRGGLIQLISIPFQAFWDDERLVERSTLKLSASIWVVKRSFSSTAIKSAWSSKSDGRPLPGLSSKLVSPDLKRANHSLHRLSLIVRQKVHWDREMTAPLSIISRSDKA